MVSDAEWADVQRALLLLKGKTIYTLQQHRPNHILAANLADGFCVRTEPQLLSSGRKRGGGTRQIGWRDIKKGYYLLASTGRWLGNPGHKNFGDDGAFVMALLAQLTTVEKMKTPRCIRYAREGRTPRLRG